MYVHPSQMGAELVPESERFRPLRTAAPEALAQCQKCGATTTVDMVDVITGVEPIHKPPDDPRYQLNSCGGRFALFQEVRSG